MHFLFPCGLKQNVIFPQFEDQAAALRSVGFTTSAFPHEVLSGRKDVVGIPKDSLVTYRGWMMTPAEYGNLSVSVTCADASMYVPAREYAMCHHLPGWYRLVKEFTPRTWFLSDNADFEKELEGIPGPFFVKDHVKSVKTKSFATRSKDVCEVVERIRSERGKIEGGVSVREVEDFDTGTERRYFVLDREAFSSDGSPIPDIVDSCIGRVHSRFFSIDTVKRKDGVMRIVEIGDGQVSDIVGWSAERFADVWARKFSKNEETGIFQ